MLRVDFGCGQNCTKTPEGEKFTGVDFVKCDGVDIVHDLTVAPYPFEDDSVDEAVSSHFVEHLTGEEFMRHFNEVHRILKKGASYRITHPYCFSVRAFQDPTHKTFIPAERYWYFDAEWRRVNKLDHYPITADFQIASTAISYHQDKGQKWDLKNEHTLNFSQGHYVNVVADLFVTLIKK